MLSPAELAFLSSSLRQSPSIRPDGRDSLQCRPIEACRGFLSSANGSARVRRPIDGAECIVGVKAQVVHLPPLVYSNNNDKDDVNQPSVEELELIQVSVSLSGARDDENTSTSLARWIHSDISKSIPLSLLRIGPRHAFILYIDIVITSAGAVADGSLPDATEAFTEFGGGGGGDEDDDTPSGDSIEDSASPIVKLPIMLVSSAVHLALIDTRLPALDLSKTDASYFFEKSQSIADGLSTSSAVEFSSKSQDPSATHIPTEYEMRKGEAPSYAAETANRSQKFQEQVPVFDNEWENSYYLCAGPFSQLNSLNNSLSSNKELNNDISKKNLLNSSPAQIKKWSPPICILIAVIGPNTIIDPSPTESAVADTGIIVSYAQSSFASSSSSITVLNCKQIRLGPGTCTLPGASTLFPSAPLIQDFNNENKDKTISTFSYPENLLQNSRKILIAPQRLFSTVHNIKAVVQPLLTALTQVNPSLSFDSF